MAARITHIDEKRTGQNLASFPGFLSQFKATRKKPRPGIGQTPRGKPRVIPTSPASKSRSDALQNRLRY